MEEIPSSILWEDEEMVCHHPLETPWALMILPGLSTQTLTTECLPKEVWPAAHVQFFTFFQDQIPLEIFTINLFSS